MTDWARHCENLSLDTNPTRTEIRRAYLRRAKLVHPDVNHGSPKAEELFKRLHHSYEYLMRNFGNRRTRFEEPTPEQPDESEEGKNKSQNHQPSYTPHRGAIEWIGFVLGIVFWSGVRITSFVLAEFVPYALGMMLLRYVLALFGLHHS